MIRSRKAIHVKLTGAGGAYLLVTFAILVAAMNYSNSMAFILCFMMLGTLISAAAMGRGYLHGIGLRGIRVHPAFAGRGVRLTLALSSPGGEARPALFAAAAGHEGYGDPSGPIVLHPNNGMTLDVGIPAEQRGEFILKAVGLETRYPLGVFRCRRELPAQLSYLVYPRPEGDRPWPKPETRWHDWTEGSHMSGGDDFAGLRPWRKGESPRHIDWKSAARGRPLSVKEFSGGGQVRIRFNWEHLPNLEVESRLSQLTRWVLDADHMGVEFGLRLPGVLIESGAGTSHTRECLEALARLRSG